MGGRVDHCQEIFLSVQKAGRLTRLFVPSSPICYHATKGEPPDGRGQGRNCEGRGRFLHPSVQTSARGCAWLPVRIFTLHVNSPVQTFVRSGKGSGYLMHV
jgi:hypothetical protein